MKIIDFMQVCASDWVELRQTKEPSVAIKIQHVALKKFNKTIGGLWLFDKGQADTRFGIFW